MITLTPLDDGYNNPFDTQFDSEQVLASQFTFEPVSRSPSPDWLSRSSSTLPLAGSSPQTSSVHPNTSPTPIFSNIPPDDSCAITLVGDASLMQSHASISTSTVHEHICASATNMSSSLGVSEP
ncbi:hypothetical protein MIND_01190300 [Mycena indigotica]|uniref:Uncharacterized protein n=1 Tax=Mycena indigotica TaxID=2126181 RepID=A0A8H6S5R1_9AGAR|nr:uncharacterized protein MIND_01190300 [Mycena indigotica]KAF7292912.1 hypothetical protein MIND_01190300 [Mycena indigotica]